MSAPVRPGPVRAVTAVSNTSVKEIRALAQRKHRAETGLFVAEGLKLVADGLAKDWACETLVMAEGMLEHPFAAKTAATARARGATILTANNAVMEAITRRDNPQSVVGVFRQRLLKLDAVDAKTATVWVALEGVRDPGNLGTIIRTADGAGASGVILIGDTTDPFSLEAVRATMGSVFHVPLVKVRTEEFLAWRPSFSGQVVGTHLKGSVDFRSADYREPAILLMGTEQSGLTEPMAAACDTLVRIPMMGGADSLNLSVSTGIALYEMRRARLPVGA